MSIDLSLDRLRTLLPHFPYSRPTIHIADTNGKGSVSAVLTSILMTSSPPLRIGRFNSPHLVSVLDSITVDNVDIARTVYERVRQEIEDLDRIQGTKLTGFEVLTMTARRIFETEKVDIVVLEVGMGGRLDATNLVPSSKHCLSYRTGESGEGKPLVLGRQTHPEVVEVVKDVVGSVGGVLLAAAQVSVSEDDLPTWSLLGNTSTSPPSKVVQFHLSIFDRVIRAHFPLQGGHQLDNLGTALGVIDAILSTETSFSSLNLKSRVTPQTLAAGIENVKWRGRLSFHTIPAPVQPSSTSTSTHTPNLPVLVDGAHNPASAHTLGTYISSLINATFSSLSTPSERNEVHIPITYILSVSHSPPKTSYQTLHPILLSSLISPSDSDPTIVLHPSVALLPFSPPDGMPWVRPTSLTEMSHAVREILPDLPKAALWVDSNLEETPDNGGATSRHEPKTLLRAALIWAASRHDRYAASSQAYSQGPVRYPGLVVLAGSLYLVAEFYRLLDEESSSVRG